MRRFYLFTSAVLVLTALAGCQNNDFSEDTYIPEKGEIVFRLANGGKATKAPGAIVKGATVDLGTYDGTNIYLEESITYLDQVSGSPETKGTPAYTENFTALYGDFKAAAFKTTGGSYEASAFDDGVFEKLDDKEMWKRKFANLDESLPLYFFLRAPYSQEGSTVTGLEYDTSDGSISFSYDGSSLTTATAQKDLLFTSREVSEDDYADFIDKNNGIPVLFHHALTGVKFAIGNTKDDQTNNSIKINSVVFTGLYDSGDCVITPTASGWRDGETTVDDIDDYSSAETTVWTPNSLTASTFSKETGFSSGNYGSPIDFESGSLPDSFYAAGNMQNLNDDDVAQTFWFVPQPLARTSSETPVTLIINYDFGAEKGLTKKLILSEILNSVEWKAGELRTYTIKIDEVNVKIEDTVTKGTNGIVGSTKNAVTITNTGNTDVFIRAAIIGQWVIDQTDPETGAVERTIMFGFTDEINQLYQVESWYEDQFVNHSGQHGEFIGLAGYSNNNKGTSYSNPYPASNGWYYEDGYYYYTKTVAPGATTASPLFSSYTISKIPHTTNAGDQLLSENMYFTLEIATQAISARNSDGTLRLDSDYLDAWDDALDIKDSTTPVEPETP